jgi:hypothetical protein
MAPHNFGVKLKWWEAYEWLKVMRVETNTRVIEYQKYYERLEVMRVENTRMIEYHYFVNHCSLLWLKVQKVPRERLEPRGSVDELRRLLRSVHQNKEISAIESKCPTIYVFLSSA